MVSLLFTCLFVSLLEQYYRIGLHANIDLACYNMLCAFVARDAVARMLVNMNNKSVIRRYSVS